MFATTLRTGAMMMAVSALLGQAGTAEAQLGSVLRRTIPKPTPSVTQPPTSQPSKTIGNTGPSKALAEAGPGRVRVRVTLKVQGGYDVRGNSGSAKRTFNDSYWSEVSLETDGELTGVNPLDPQSVTAAGQAHGRIRAQGASGRSGMGARPGGGVPGLGSMDMATMMAMEQKVRACGNDQACTQRLVMIMMNEQMGNAGGSPQTQRVRADMQAISDVCVNEKRQPAGSKGYEACLDAEGRKRTTRTDDVVSAEELLPDRYLSYVFVTDEGGCRLTGHTTVDRTAQGVQIIEGPGVPYSFTEVGEGSAPLRSPLCGVGQALVYDTKTNTVWGNAPFFPPDANIKSTATNTVGDPSGVRQAINDYNFVADVDGQRMGSVIEWVQKTLTGQLATSGEKSQVFVSASAAGMTGSGKLTATLSWSIVRD